MNTTSNAPRCRAITAGTAEWAVVNANCISGCKNDCLYCYARNDAVRHKRKTADTWKIMEVRQAAVEKNYRKVEGRVMFPSTHDIVLDEPFFSACTTVLDKLLAAGNHVLIVSKPSLPVITKLCERYASRKDQITFRFTITTISELLREFWEPAAPPIPERIRALKLAFEAGFTTSVSIEPCLDYTPVPLIEAIKHHVSETIWWGVMNYIPWWLHRLDPARVSLYQLEAVQESEEPLHVKEIHDLLVREPAIRFKDSIARKLAQAEKADRHKKQRAQRTLDTFVMKELTDIQEEGQDGGS